MGISVQKLCPYLNFWQCYSNIYVACNGFMGNTLINNWLCGVCLELHWLGGVGLELHHCLYSGMSKEATKGRFYSVN